MRASWSLVAAVALCGTAAGYGLARARRDEPALAPAHDVGVRAIIDDGDLSASPDRARARAARAEPGVPSVTAPAKPPPARGGPDGKTLARRLREAAAAKERDPFVSALRDAAMSSELEAHAAIVALIGDVSFELPNVRPHVLTLRPGFVDSPVPGFADAARRRYERDLANPATEDDARQWLVFVAAHGTADDVRWVEAQLADAHHPEVVLEALAHAPAPLARDALRRALVSARFGMERALEKLVERAPAEAYPLLEEMFEQGTTGPGLESSEVARLWGRAALPDRVDALRQVLARTADTARQMRAVYAVQELKPPLPDAPEIANVLSSPARGLRALDASDESGWYAPMYAIQYNALAQTKENVTALDETGERIGGDRGKALRQVAAQIRRASDWK